MLQEIVLTALIPLLTIISIPSPDRQYAPASWETQPNSQSLKQHQAKQVEVTSKSWQGKLTVDTISGGHSQVVYAVAFSPDARALASGSKDGAIKIWRVSP